MYDKSAIAVAQIQTPQPNRYFCRTWKLVLFETKALTMRRVADGDDVDHIHGR